MARAIISATVALLLLAAHLCNGEMSFLQRRETNRIRFEFALKFESFPTGNVNTAYARNQQLMTSMKGGEPSFTLGQTGSDPDDVGAVWRSFLVKQVGNVWSEAGNITFTDESKNESNAIFFQSIGLSGHQLLDAPDLNYGYV